MGMFGAMAFAGGGHPYLVNLGSGGTPTFYRGFYDVASAGIGSTTPAGITVNGELLEAVVSGQGDSYDLDVILDDTDENAAQTDFTGIIVQDSGGAFRTYLTADATFTTGGSPQKASWRWGSGSDDVFVSSPTVDPTQFTILL